MIWAWVALYFLAAFCCPVERRARGRIFSRWMRRLLRIRDIFLFRFVQLILVAVLRAGFTPLLGETRSRAVFWFLATALYLDDWLTGGDDDPWWRRAVGKVKLWMPAPVKLRPIDHLTPCIEGLLQ